MDGVMSQRIAAPVYLMWPLPCTQFTYVRTHLVTRIHKGTHTKERMTVNHGCDMCVCVCEWVEDEERGPKSTRGCCVSSG